MALFDGNLNLPDGFELTGREKTMDIANTSKKKSGVGNGLPDKFLGLVPRDANYCNLNFDAIYLRVVRDDGVEFEPDIKFNKVTLSGNKKIFRNQSGNQDSFKITVFLHRSDTVMGYSGKHDWDAENSDELAEIQSTRNYQEVFVIDALDYWIRKGTPFYIASWAIGLEDTTALWMVTENKKRKQKYKSGYVEWDLTFTRYKNVHIGTFNSTSKGVKAAISNYKKAKKKAKAKNKTTSRQKLKKCDYKKLVYSKTKKTSDCVKYMQAVLWKEGRFSKKLKKSEAIDGWFGDDTKAAVKSYQKKYAKKYGLKETGKVDYSTWLAMCGEATVVTLVTTDNKSQTKNTTSKDKNKGTITNVNVSKDNIKNSTVTVKSTSVKSQKNKSSKTKAKKGEGTAPKTSKKVSTKNKKKNTLSVDTQKGKAKKKK